MNATNILRVDLDSLSLRVGAVQELANARWAEADKKLKHGQVNKQDLTVGICQKYFFFQEGIIMLEERLDNVEGVSNATAALSKRLEAKVQELISGEEEEETKSDEQSRQ